MTTNSKLINQLIIKRRSIDEVFFDFCIDRGKRMFTYFNQNSFNIFYENNDYRQILNSFNVYQEGIGLFLALKFLKIKEAGRIDATEVHEKMIKSLISKNEKIIFIGGRYEENELFRRCKIAKLNLEYYHHGYFDLNGIDDLVQNLNSKDAKFILIGMGTPKQELLAYKLSSFFTDKKIICIGNFMNYFLGYQKRAPKLLRVLQLEWFYRFLQDPYRLFKRYILGIPVFFWRVFKLKLNNDKLLQ